MNSTLLREPVRARGSAVSAVRPSLPDIVNAVTQPLAAEDQCDSGSPSPNQGSSGQPWRHLTAVVAGAVAFLGIASLIKPDPRTAWAYEEGATPVHSAVQPLPAAQPNDVAAQLAQAPHPKGWRVIGSLESTEHIVLVYASPDGPRYSVFTLQGRLISADLPAEDVYREVPDLDLSTLRDLPASDGKPLMMATPQE